MAQNLNVSEFFDGLLSVGFRALHEIKEIWHTWKIRDCLEADLR